MKLPGEALLEFAVEPERWRMPVDADRPFPARAGSRASLYWYGVRPLHGIVFRGMIRGIRDSALETKPGA